ncbi:MAG: patatin-like phospholipase family protein [Nitrospiria bacterium]
MMQHGKPDNEARSIQNTEGLKKTPDLSDWYQCATRLLGRPPKIGLALGSGATFGVVHIGVLSVFHHYKIPISYLSGCSSGAFVGALYAGGVEGKALDKCGKEYGWRDAGRLALPTMGLASNVQMSDYLLKRIGDIHFEALPLPFFAVGTNLRTGRLKIFHSGPIIPAIRASCALPGIFAPVEIDGELYCDGGILMKIPCSILRDAGADFVIAVDLVHAQQKIAPKNIFEVIRRAADIAATDQVQNELETANLVIQPSLPDLNKFGFNHNIIQIERGRQVAIDALGQWLNQVQARRRLS